MLAIGSVANETTIELGSGCKTLASKTNRGMQSFEYRSVRYLSKEINGTLTGGQKN